ncbi:MAG: 16S rRNA (adenine(1518)-N(6)/adenine(1519)-N(6))-dimethyltransferase RsmA [Synergistaceae bacterium]|jgi:16S rRNA (adenine1518-N6/adenine1519-N6)-dimethyltransferase|nr:16S rRNA (adenine(1518)-N(6)/adenine(1519)-N(6))-dimethyltransferase RsmA [Synergistaceae bacterium]
MAFRHNTKIGQNFLTDRSVSAWMTERARLTPADRVLEIGPGTGTLTKSILASGCARVDAVETDVRLKEYLEPIAASDNRLRLHWADAVKFDYSVLDETPTRVIANLPYHITTPLLWKLLESFAGSDMRYMLLMIQDEAASRVAAGAGNRESNPLSVTIAAAGQATVPRKVSRTAFYPSPRVDSAIAEITLHAGNSPHALLPRDAAWRKLLSGSFAMRRKTLVNNWAGAFGIKKDDCAGILAAHSLGARSRPEELTLRDWLSLREDSKLTSCAKRRN